MILSELVLIYDFIKHNATLNNSTDIDNWGRIKTIIEREINLKTMDPRKAKKDSQGNNMIDRDYE